MAKKVPNEWPITVNGVEVESRKIGIEEAKELVGWRDAKKGEHGYPYIGPDGKGKFVLDNNKSNRPLKLKLAKDYKDQMLRGEWAGQWNSPSATHNGETMVVDAEGGIVSCAHRCVGLILAELERQRLEALSDGSDSPAGKKLDEYGCKRPITIETLVVKGIDPKAADTADIGRTRTFGDVIYRHHEFGGNGSAPGTEASLSKQDAGAIRLVWLRLQGRQVSRGPKVAIPTLLSFSQKHPLLREAVKYISELNSGAGKTSPRISRLISPGYAAGLLYLAAFSKSDRGAYEAGSLDLSAKPEQWSDAERFWKLFADDLHLEENVIRSLHAVLGANQGRAAKFRRDDLCTLVARAFLSWIGDDDKWSKEDSLKKGLSKGADVQRFGGLDLNRPTLMEMGFIQSDEPIVRARSGEWRLDQETLVVGSKFDDWWGKIDSFTDDGKTARVIDVNGEYVDCQIEWLTTEEGTAGIGE